MEEVELELTKVAIWEVIPCLNERSALGRVVINPPARMGPLVPRVTGEEWYICDTCGFACLSGDKMFEHKEKHLNYDTTDTDEEDEDDDQSEQSLQINDSDKHVSSPVDYEKDIINKKNGGFQCGICLKVVASRRNLRRHYFVHQRKKPIKCKVCGAPFTKQSNLDTHTKRSHDPAFTNRCQLCPCSFATILGLRRHCYFYHNQNGRNLKPKKPRIEFLKQKETALTQRIKKKTTGTRKKEAFLTPKTTNTNGGSIKMKFIYSAKNTSQPRSILKAILQNAKKGSNLGCDICGKQFRKSSNLRCHMRVHSGERPYKCAKCQAAFQTSGNLIRHERNIHSNGSFKCPYCPCKFANKGTLTYHQKGFHKDINRSAKAEEDIEHDIKAAP